MPSSAFANGTILNGEYSLLDPIPGSGGRVVRARRVRDGEIFAARMLTPRYAMDIARALERLHAASQVHHQAVAAVEGYGEHDGRFAIVSEYVDGRPLDVWADAVGIPPLSRVIALVHRVCAGLHVAERLNVAHAALHPGNVLVVQRDEEKPQIKVVDLGVPPFMREWPPLPQNVPYMAPEQVLAALMKPGVGPDTDSRAHVYACGCLLYELCTGGAPFAEQDLQELAVAHADGKLIAPSRINPLVPPALEAIIMKALERLPEARFARSAELAQALSGLKLTSSSSGVRPRVTIHPPAPSDSGALGEDKRTTARTGFEERPTVERQLPGDWPDLERQSSVPAAAQDVPTKRPPPPLQPASPVAVPATRASQPARILPPDPFEAAVVVESASLARIEPDALAVPEPKNRYIFVPTQVREREHARKLRLVLYFAAGFAATTAGYFALRTPGTELASATAVDLTTVASSDAAASVPAPAPELSRVVAVDAPSDRSNPTVNVPAEHERAARVEATPPAPRVRRVREVSSIAAHRSPSTAPADSAPAPRAAIDPPAEAPPVHENARAASVDEARPPHAAPREPEPSLTEAEAKATHLQPAGHKLSVATAAAPRVQPAPAPAPVSLASAKLGIASLEVRGSLATGEVRRGLERIRSQLRACYTNTPASQSAAVPRALRVEVDLDERGRARNPRVLGSAPPALSKCVAQSLQRLVSGTAPDTGTVKAAFVLELDP